MHAQLAAVLGPSACDAWRAGRELRYSLHCQAVNIPSSKIAISICMVKGPCASPTATKKLLAQPYLSKATNT